MLISVQRIWDQGTYSCFTDLVRRYYEELIR